MNSIGDRVDKVIPLSQVAYRSSRTTIGHLYFHSELQNLLKNGSISYIRCKIVEGIKKGLKCDVKEIIMKRKIEYVLHDGDKNKTEERRSAVY